MRIAAPFRMCTYCCAGSRAPAGSGPRFGDPGLEARSSQVWAAPLTSKMKDLSVALRLMVDINL